MKVINKIFPVLAAIVLLTLSAGCTKDQFKEKETLDLSRCLTPTELSAKVLSTEGNVVVFNWNVGKDAQAYNVELYSDAGLNTLAKLPGNLSNPFEVSPDDVPLTMELEADATYYFRIQALGEGKQASNWAVYSDSEGNAKAINTYAVKDDLFLKVAAREATSVTLSWSTEVSDYADVTYVTYGLSEASDGWLVKELSQEEKEAASVTVTDLTPSTEYAFQLFYLTACRGQVDVWTTPDTSTATEVNTLEALTNALKTPGAQILLAMEGSPYVVGSMDIANGVSVLGKGEADGSKPVIEGEFHITDSFDGGDLYFEGVDFNGASTYGFAIQHKNGCAVDGVKVSSIIYKNCDIHDYTKGIMYEWSKTLEIGEFTYNGCHIYNVNKDGTQGGDGFDLRNATKIDKLNFINCTIYNGFRTFLRIDAAPVLGDVVVDNNLLMNLCFVDNTNNAGLFGFQVAPASLSFKKNIIMNMVDKAVLESTNTKYIALADLGLAASSNYCYNVVEGFFTDNASAATAACKEISADPCYNAKGGVFNILADSEISGLEVGPAEWWTPYSKEPEDLTLLPLEGAHTWDFTNAKYFVGSAKEPMVRDQLYIDGSEDYPISFNEGEVTFSEATLLNKKGVPTANYLAFKVTQSGSVVINPTTDASSHFIVATGAPEGAATVSVKGGVASNGSGVPQKVVVKGITEETMIFVYTSGAIALDALAWSCDTTSVNTALPAPVPTASPASFTAGEATDVVISWPEVENAASYSVVFNGKSYDAVQDEVTLEWSYTIESTTTSMLDAGSYTAAVYANPGEDDIYNTMSDPGTAAFAILPKGGEEGDTEFVVKSVDEFNAALAAGKTEISIAEGNYEIGAIELPANIHLKNQTGCGKPALCGAFKIKGEELGDITLEGLKLVGNTSYTNAFTVSNKTGDGATDFVSANSVKIIDCEIRDYSKSVWYNPKGNKSTAESAIGSLIISDCIISNCTTGQNTIDIRDGHYDEVKLEHNTFESCAVSGADVLRIDDTQNGLVEIPTFIVQNNTFYNCANGSGKAIFYVREGFTCFNVANNLFIGTDGSSAQLMRSGVVMPSLKNNFYYNVGEKWFTGNITEDGTTLTTSPVKNAASGDYTLTSALVMSCNAGARRWNPTWSEAPGGNDFTVTSAEEFTAALSAGKTDLTLAAGNYEIGTIEVPAGLRMSGASSTGKPVVTGALKLKGEGLGKLSFENIIFQGSSSCSNAVTVSNKTGDGATDFVSASSVTFKNCQFKDYSKSVWYNPKGNKSTAESEISSVMFDGCRFTNCTTGQNTIDVRDGKYGIITIKNSTFEACAVSGAEVFRIDDGQNGLVECDGFVVKNNTFYNCSAASGKAIFYVRETFNTYNVEGNLFIGTSTAAGKYSRSTVVMPALKNNFFYSVGENWFTGDITEDGTVLASDPVKDAANGDYTLTNALVMSCNAGAPCWNPSWGQHNPDDFFTVSSKDEFDAALSAGKYHILLTPNAEGYALGSVTAVNCLYLKGKVVNGKKPAITGSFKLAGELGDITFENLDLGGDSSNGNAFTVSNKTGDGAAELVSAGVVTVKNCDIHDYSKSVWYNPKGNKSTAESTISAVRFTGCTIKNCTTGQNTIDIRDGAYGTFSIEKSTFISCAKSGADLFRIDEKQNGVVEMGAFTVKDNTFYGCAAASGKAVLYVRVPLTAFELSGNLFAGTAESAGLFGRARAALGEGYIAPTLTENYFYQMGADAFGDKDDIKADYGTVLDADPFTDAANGNFKLKSALPAGDPRWR